MRHYDEAHFDATSAAMSLTPADYVRLIHPDDAIGKPTLMTKDGSGRAHSKTFALATAPVLVDTFLDNDGYISLHRFHGPRGICRLAALNGLFLDLDVDRLPTGACRPAKVWSDEVSMLLSKLGLPRPTILLATGRGLAAIWLINPLPPQALPRWQSVQNVLIDLFQCLGADPACRDAARVTRLPGSFNSKSQSFASIIGGSLARYDFDQLADEVYAAAGRPTRDELRLRKERRIERKAKKRANGLTPVARFQAIQRDLERLRHRWGGLVPEGSRNTWLHLFATCVSHTSEGYDVENVIEHMGAEATPGLPRSEVAAIAKIAVRHASLPRSSMPELDGRYHYAGATVAELLGVTAEGARTLGLEQVMPKEERARRKAERESGRRRAAGAASREEWLHENSRERQKPWTELGMSRSTYYRRLRAGQIVEPSKTVCTAIADETGPCPLLGGSAMPEAQAEGRSPAAKSPIPPVRARGRTRPAQACENKNLPPQLEVDCTKSLSNRTLTCNLQTSTEKSILTVDEFFAGLSAPAISNHEENLAAMATYAERSSVWRDVRRPP